MRLSLPACVICTAGAYTYFPGGDCGAFITNPIGENAKDLEHFVDLFGFSPIEAIVAATRPGAELMRMETSTGQIKPGFYADLLLLDGNPLDDIRVLQNQERIVGVLKGGRFAKRTQRLAVTHPPPEGSVKTEGSWRL